MSDDEELLDLSSRWDANDLRTSGSCRPQCDCNGPAPATSSFQSRFSVSSVQSVDGRHAGARCPFGGKSLAHDPLGTPRDREVEYDSCLVHALLNVAEAVNGGRARAPGPTRGRGAPSRQPMTRTGPPSGATALSWESRLPSRVRSGRRRGRGARTRGSGVTLLRREHSNCGTVINAKQLTEVFYGSNTSWKMAEAAYLHFVEETRRQQLPGIYQGPRSRRW